jgi:hypothetical protein
VELFVELAVWGEWLVSLPDDPLGFTTADDLASGAAKILR